MTDQLIPGEADVEIDEIVDRLQNIPEADAPAGLAIADLDRADRALAKIGRLDAGMSQVTTLYRQRLDQLQAWYEDEQARHERARAWVEAGLNDWHARVLAEDPKAKTVRLPSGEHKARQLPTEWEFTDEATFIAWAEATGEDDLLNRPAPRVDRPAVKRAFKAYAVEDDGRVVLASGEIVPGLRVRPGAVRFTAAPNGGAS